MISKKNIKILSLIVVLVFAGTIILLIAPNLSEEDISEKTEEAPEIEWDGPSQNAEIFRIAMGGEGTPLERVIIDPLPAVMSKDQVLGTFISKDAEVELVYVKINTDKEKITQEMSLLREDDDTMLWVTSWKVHDLTPRSNYRINFFAESKEGEVWEVTALNRTVSNDQ